MKKATSQNLHFNFQRFFVLFALMLMLAVTGWSQNSAKRSRELIVSLQPGTNIATFNARHRTQVIEHIPGTNQYLLSLSSDASVDSKRSQVAGDPEVIFASPNYVVKQGEISQTSAAYVDQTSAAYVDQTSAAYVDQTSAAYVDAVLAVRFYGQSSISRLRLTEAHSYTRGLGVRVAVIDTGIDATHPLLSRRIVWPNYDFVDNDANPQEVAGGAGYGHGTFVAGLIASTAPGALIMPLRAFGPDGSGTSFNIAKAIRFAADNGAQVINMSFGLLENDELINEALDYAKSKAYMVAAAGNDNQPTLHFPANRNSKTLAVTSTDNADKKASFSNYDRDADVAAPGINLWSSYPGNRWGIWSGTSFSTALVAGQAALLLQINPSLNRSELDRLITRSGIDIDALNTEYAGKLGTRINFLQAVLQVR